MIKIEKFYCLEMFPYPSVKFIWGMSGITQLMFSLDIKICKALMFTPMGWDSFGMPAENAARQNNLDPKPTESNIE